MVVCTGFCNSIQYVAVVAGRNIDYTRASPIFLPTRKRHYLLNAKLHTESTQLLNDHKPPVDIAPLTSLHPLPMHPPVLLPLHPNPALPPLLVPRISTLIQALREL